MNAEATVPLVHRAKHFFWLKFLPCFFGFFLGCMACHLLRTRLGLDAVTAAAAAGFSGTFLPLPAKADKTVIRAAIYSGAFAGMCSSEVIGGPAQVLIVSVPGALIYLALTPFFQGLGGKLGAIAFATTALVFLIRILL